MKVIDSHLFQFVKETKRLKIGTFYFFENIVIAEIKNGIHIDLITSKNSINEINKFYGREKPFGYITNRINEFSISPLDYPKFSKLLTNLKVICAVATNHFDIMNIEIEKRFSKIPFHSSTNLIEAFELASAILNSKQTLLKKTS